MYKTIQSALHKTKALQRGVEEALKIYKGILRETNKIIKMIKNKQQSRYIKRYCADFMHRHMRKEM